jgi:hypothetical protein
LFVEILLLAKLAGILKVGNLSLDGSKIHADASKSKAVSYGRLVELEKQLQNEVKQLFELGEQADQGEATIPEGLIIEDEIAFRKARLENLANAKAVLEARAKERYEQEKAEYDAKMKAREEKAKKQGKKPRGKSPEPPKAGPNDKDQYNFTDPDSRIMKNSTNTGYDQHYNAQVAVIIQTTSAKQNLPWMPCLQNLDSRKAQRWIMAFSVNITFWRLSNGTSSRTLQLDENHTTKLLIPCSEQYLPSLLLRPVQKRKWPINWLPRSAKRSIACENAPLNQLSASLKKFLVFANFLCAVWQTLLENGVLCAWRSI